EAPVRRDGAVHRQRARCNGEIRARRRRHARDGRPVPRAGDGAPRGSATRPALRAGRDRRRWRSAVRRRAGRDVHPAAVRRPRDHHASSGQRPARAAALPEGAGEAARRSGARAGRGGGAAALRRADRRTGSHRAGTADASRQAAQDRRAGVPADERGEPRPARLPGSRPHRPRAQRRAAPYLRLRRPHLSRLSAGAARGPGRAARGARALAAHRARERRDRMDGLDGVARHEGDAAAGDGVTSEPDHLPRRLWWVPASLTLAWGFNWTALKTALAEWPAWTLRSLCLGLGSAVLFLALRVGGQRLVLPSGQWGRIWLLALLNITSWNMLVAFGVGMIP